MKKKPAGATKQSVAQAEPSPAREAKPAKDKPAKEPPPNRSLTDSAAPDKSSTDVASANVTPAHDSAHSSPPALANEPAVAPSPVREAAVTPAEVPAVEPAATPLPHKLSRRDEIDQYLWSVYQRSSVKRDGSGDFTWKDEAAAAHMGLVTRQYVIGGMDLDFRELLYNLGHAMDADGVQWTILSGFRDDYRQGLASGYKAHVGNSFHGGSRATGGYGHGCAADIEASNGEGSSNSAVWRWVDQHGEKFGIFRPMKQIDPAHIQPFGGWHDVAINLRTKDAVQTYLPASVDSENAGKPPVSSLVDTRSNVTEAQYDCVRSHGGHFRVAGFPHHSGGGSSHTHHAIFHGRIHRFGRRRMIVIISGMEKRADAAEVNDKTGTTAEAQASGKNRHDARPGSDVKSRKVADAQEKNPRPHKEAAPSAGKAHRNAMAPDVKAPEAKTARVQLAKFDDGKARQAKAQKVAAGGKHPQKHAADAKASPAKSKNRVADRQDGPGSKKL